MSSPVSLIRVLGLKGFLPSRAATVAPVPVLGDQADQLVPRPAGEFLQRGAHALGDQLQAGQVPHRGQDMSGVTLVSGAFTPGAVEALAPRIEELAHRHVDAFASAGEADLVTAYTGPLPMAVICELLGLPAERRDDLQSWTRAAMTNPSGRQRACLLALNTYLRGLLEEKRRRPQDDLLSRLIAVRDEDDGRLSDTELLGSAVILVAAGHETTVNLLGNALAALLDHPEQARALRLSPEGIPGAVEEFLRYDAPVESSPTRFATDRFTLGGAVVEAGDTVTVALTSAGRDAPVEADGDPDRLDVLRNSARHMSFSHGIHYCIGAPLARLEATIALRVC
jgi:cytochrome P450